MNIVTYSDANLLKLLTWLSPNFPVGAYIYSHGIEFAVEEGLIKDAYTLQNWIEGVLTYGAGCKDGILFSETWKAAREKNDVRLLELSEMARAFQPTAEMEIESHAQGNAFIDAVCAAWPSNQLNRISSYIKQNKRIRSLLLLGLSSEVFGWAHESMVPVVTKYVLEGGSVELGYILASGQAGALISTLVLSNYRIKKNRTLILYLTYILFGLFLIGFVWSKILFLSMLLYCLVFLAVATYEVVLHSLMQTIVPNLMRGRVVSFQILTWGATGISGFMLGVLAGFTSPPIAITINTSILVLNGTRNIVKKILTNKSILSYWQ